MGTNFKKPKKVSKKTSNYQQQPQVMTKKQRKEAMWTEVGRLDEKIPYMWSDFAMQIAYHNIDNPKNKITDAFLMKVIEQGEKMDIRDDAVTHLETNNSTTNYNSLKALMGNQLFNEVLSCGVSWGYFAKMYNSIYVKKFFG